MHVRGTRGEAGAPVKLESGVGDILRDEIIALILVWRHLQARKRAKNQHRAYDRQSMLLRCGMERTILRGVPPRPQQVCPTFSCLNVHESAARKKLTAAAFDLELGGPENSNHQRFWIFKKA